MKKSLFLASAVLLSIAAGAQTSSPYLTKNFSENITSVDSRTQGGNITLTGDATGQSTVEVYVTSNNGRTNRLSNEEIQQRLAADYDLNISVSGGKLTATAKAKHNFSNWNKALSISFKISVPQAVSSSLRTSGGNISISKLSGTEEFETSGGNLNVSNISGTINGHTSGGNIDVANCKSDIDLETSGGNIDAEHCSGKITLNTSGGNLTLETLSGTIKAVTSGGNVGGNSVDGKLSAHTSGGNVSLDNLTCTLDASTSGGNIDIELKELREYVKIRNSSGEIAIKIPANKGVDLQLNGGKIKTGTLQNFQGTVEDHEISGKINGGGVLVSADAGSGRVNLSFR